MYIFKNAFISIKRNKGRNILIGIIILVISCAASISLAIKNTATTLIDSYESSYEKEATISFDRKNMMKNFEMSSKENMEEAKNAFDNVASYTIDNVKEYANSSFVENYYYTYEIQLNGNSIEKVSSDFSFGANDKKRPMVETEDFKLIGYNAINRMTDFIEGNYKMTEITEDAWDKIMTGNYVLINQELATLNEIKLNDEIILEDKEGKTYSFEVLGFYESEETTDEVPTNMFSSEANTIITGADYLVDTFSTNESINATIVPTFILKNYEDVEKFQEELYGKGLDENYIISTNEEEALSAVSSVTNVNSFVTTFLVITLIIGAVVLFVINMINIRERKYEIGVLRTIGVSKLKLTCQFVFELFLVSFIAIALGAVIGSFSSKAVGNHLLANEIAASKEENSQIEENMKMNPGKQENGMKGVRTIQAYNSMDAIVDIKVLGELIGIGIVLVFISSLASMISIERFSPLTILKERS